VTKISKRIVDAARPGPKPVFTWDATLPGFGLLVLPSGSKSFVFQYRTREGKTRRATIAKVGAITPDEARALAERMSAAVKGGGDPLDERAAAREALTVGELLDAYLKSEKFKAKAESTRVTDQGRIERHLRPLLGGRHCAKVQPEDVRRAFAAIRAGKTAKTEKTGPRGLSRVRGGEGAARKCVRLLAAVFAWGITEKLVEANPVSGIAVGSDGEREAVLDADGYARLFAALDAMEAERRVRPAVADAIRLIALTGARRGEVLGLRWRHVDLRNGRIVIPPAAHKTGHATGKPRIINLETTGQEIIARQPAGKPDELVFRPSKGQGPLTLAKPWRALRKEAQLPEDMLGVHGLRHSLATALAVGGAQASEVMAALGHRKLATSQRYVHFAEEARKRLAERAAGPALAGMAAASSKPNAAVTALKGGAG
jgi:integrase